MPYHVKCIIPHERYCHFDGLNLVSSSVSDAAKADEDELLRLEDTKIWVTGPDGIRQHLSLLEVSSLLRFAYASHLSFMDERDLRIMPVTWGLPHFSDDTMTAISPTAEELGIVVELENGQICKDVDLRYIDCDMGWGVFATNSISSETFVGEYTGIVLFNQNPGPYSLNFPCLDGGHEINAADTGNIIRFVNHSSRPNSEFQRVFHMNIVHTVLRLCRDVAKNEQILVDYSPSYWVGRGVAPMES